MPLLKRKVLELGNLSSPHNSQCEGTLPKKLPRKTKQERHPSYISCHPALPSLHILSITNSQCHSASLGSWKGASKRPTYPAPPFQFLLKPSHTRVEHWLETCLRKRLGRLKRAIFVSHHLFVSCCLLLTSPQNTAERHQLLP